MKKYLLNTFVFLLLIQRLVASDISCYIKINLSDCEVCLYKLKNITLLNSEIKRILVLEEIHNDNQLKISNELLGIKNENYDTLIFNDSIYNALSNEDISSVHVFINLKQIFNFKLREFEFNNINLINNLVKIDSNYNIADSIPLKIKLSKSIKCSLIGIEKLVIQDKSYKSLAIYDIIERKILFNIQLNDSLSLLNYKANYNGRDSLYWEAKRIYDFEGKPFNGKIESFNIAGDTIYIIGTNMVPSNVFIENKWDTLLSPIYSLYIFKMNQLIKVNPIKNINPDKGKFHLVPHNFFVQNGNLNILIFQSKKNIQIDYNSAFFVGVWALNAENQEFNFKEFAPFYLPEIHKKNNLEYNLLDFIYHSNYLMTIISNDLYSTKSHIKPLKLPIEIGNPEIVRSNNTIKAKIEYLTIDFVLDVDTLKVLYKFNNNFYICSINLKSNILLNNFILLNDSLVSNNYLVQPKFINKNEIYFITNEKVFIKIKLRK
jgi:hypothetical protein